MRWDLQLRDGHRVFELRKDILRYSAGKTKRMKGKKLDKKAFAGRLAVKQDRSWPSTFCK